MSFRWSPTGASTEKWKAGDQTFPVTELADVEWRSPEVFNGCLRLVPRDGRLIVGEGGRVAGHGRRLVAGQMF